MAAPRPQPAVRLPLTGFGIPGAPQFLLGLGASLLTVHFVDSTHLLVTYNLRDLVERIPGDPPGDSDRGTAALLHRTAFRQGSRPHTLAPPRLRPISLGPRQRPFSAAHAFHADLVRSAGQSGLRRRLSSDAIRRGARRDRRHHRRARRRPGDARSFASAQAETTTRPSHFPQQQLSGTRVRPKTSSSSESPELARPIRPYWPLPQVR